MVTRRSRRLIKKPEGSQVATGARKGPSKSDGDPKSSGPPPPPPLPATQPTSLATATPPTPPPLSTSAPPTPPPLPGHKTPRARGKEKVTARKKATPKPSSKKATPKPSSSKKATPRPSSSKKATPKSSSLKKATPRKRKRGTVPVTNSKYSKTKLDEKVSTTNPTFSDSSSISPGKEEQDEMEETTSSETSDEEVVEQLQSRNGDDYDASGVLSNSSEDELEKRLPRKRSLLDDDQGNKIISSDDDEETLDPLTMIDAQQGQLHNTTHIFGNMDENIYGRKRVKKGGNFGKRRISKPVQGLIGEAQQTFIDKRYDECLSKCMEIIRLQPRLPDPYHILTNLWYEKGNLEKEFEALTWVNHLDSDVKRSNLLRQGELGLLLGADRKLIRSYDEKDIFESEDEIEEELKDEDYVGPDGRTIFSTTSRLDMLQKGNDALLRVERRDPDEVSVALQRGLILEHIGDFQKATELYKKLIQRLFEKKQLNFAIVQRLARAYSYNQEFQKHEALLSKYVGCVLYPTAEELPSIRAQAIQSTRERERRRIERLRFVQAQKRRQKKMKKHYVLVDSGMALERNFVSLKKKAKRRKKRGTDNINDSADDEEEVNKIGTVLPEESEGEEEESSDEEDEVDGISKQEIDEEREQLDAGITILSMLLELTIFERKDYNRGLHMLLRFMNFQKHGLCSIREKNQWDHWDKIRPEMYVDLCQLLVICYIETNNVAKAHDYMSAIKDVRLVQDNARLIRFQASIADAWMRKQKYLMARTIIKKLVTVDNLKISFQVGLHSMVAYCSEMIDLMGVPVKAAKTAWQEAITALQDVIAMIVAIEEDEPERFLQFVVEKDSFVARLSRMYRKKNRMDDNEQLLLKHGQSSHFKENFGKYSDDLAEPLELVKMGGGINFFAQSHQKRRFGEIFRQRTVPKHRGRHRDVVSNFIPNRGLSKAASAALREIHECFEEEQYQACVDMSCMLVGHLFGSQEHEYKKFKLHCTGKRKEGVIKFGTTLWEKDFTSLKAVGDSKVVNFVKEFCQSLINVGKGHLAVAFLLQIVPPRKKLVKGEHNRRELHDLQIMTSLSLYDYSGALDGLKFLLKRAKQVEKDEDSWGGSIKQCWETCNALMSCMHWDPGYASGINSAVRRFEALGPLPGNQQNQPRSFALTMLIANENLYHHDLIRALSNYFIARSLEPESPLVCLCLCATYLRLFSSKECPERNTAAIKAIAQMEEYHRKRMAQATTQREQVSFKCEYFFNMGRLAQQLQVPILAETFYKKALTVPKASLQDTREAALNLLLYYRRIGNRESAKHITNKFLVI